MKNIFTYLILLIGGNQLIAQPVIDASYYPQPGQVQERVSVIHLGIEPGEAGANRTWDFTGLQLPAGAQRTTFENVLPAETPFGSAFPQANVAGVITDTVELYAYYKTGNDGWHWLGVGTEFGPQEFEDPLTILKPLAFNESFTDQASAAYIFPEVEYHQYIEEEVWYRAYGTLKLPQATFHNVILVETNQLEIDSFLFVEEGFYSVDTLITQIWNWMIPNVAGPIGTLSITNGTSKFVVVGEEPQYSSFGPEYDVAFDINTTTSVHTPKNQSITQFSCAPNPATGMTWLSIDAKNGFSNATLKLLDGMGRVIRTENLALTDGEQSIPLDLTGLPSGLYWVSLLVAGENQATQIMIK